MGFDPNPKIAPKGPKRCKKAPNGAELNKKDRAVIPKPKLIVYIDRFQKSFVTPSQVKNSPERPKKGRNYPKLGQIKIIRWGCTSRTKVDSLYK